jgi:hypothetical protein
MTLNFKLFQNKIDFQKVLDKNLIGARELEKTYLWGAVYAIDQNINIEGKIKTDKKASLRYKAYLFEKLSSEAENKGNLACVSFAENALRLYQQIKDNDNISRLEKRYNEVRGKFSLMKFKQELPEEYVESMNLRITEAIENSTEEEILIHFITTPWYYPCDYIKERAKELSNQSFLLSMIPVTIMDKFGNTIEAYFTDEEKEKYNFWNSYNFYFQIGTQTMHRFFIEAYKAGKLNYNSTIGYLERTWLNDDIERQYHGQSVNVKPIETLKPGIKRIFEELDRFFSTETYTCDFVTITDSITLKIEGLIRYLCEKIGIATFKPNKKRNEKIMFEKTLDDLLADIQDSPPLKPDRKTNFDENDRMMIKFVMTDKAGFNLRNQVAHGLLDINEYSFQNVTVLFCLILKLSKYKFKIN